MHIARASQTLAAALRDFSPGLSWTQARRLIASRRVRVGGTVCLDDARRLHAGEQVEVLEAAPSARAIAPVVRIVYRDTHLVVIDKPAGLQTLRRIEERDWSDERKKRQPVVQELVAELLYPHATKRHPAPTVRAVHRLDRDTSGLMLFALSAAAETDLIRRFARHDVHRVYQAVVLGKLTGERTIETFIIRDRGDGIRGSIAGPNPPDDTQRAVTHVRPIRAIRDSHTLVECRLETGRTHQIRIHLAEIGHMLCGEKMYGRPRLDAPIVEDRSRALRQALHSAELQFVHPATGQPMEFQSDWPEDMVRWMGHL